MMADNCFLLTSCTWWSSCQLLRINGSSCGGGEHLQGEHGSADDASSSAAAAADTADTPGISASTSQQHYHTSTISSNNISHTDNFAFLRCLNIVGWVTKKGRAPHISNHSLLNK